ncbi:MAG: beta-eliminating lyase-related protein [Pseudomonadota bacterium]
MNACADFASDNTAPAHDAVLQALQAHNHSTLPAYGDDALTQEVAGKVSDIFETRASVLLVPTGTAANAIAIAAMMESFGMVLCHQYAHIQVDECGAPEFFAGGVKTIALPGDHGKLSLEVLQDFFQTPWQGVVHRSQPMVLSLTQLSESGTAYSLEETRGLCDFAHAHNMKVHMDGARFANAMVGLGATPAAMSWQAGVDILTFGATKNGTLGCEAIVAFDTPSTRRLPFLRKRTGHLLSKMRLLSAQISGYLADDLWIKNATHANAMAKKLSEGLTACADISLIHVVEGNQIFLTMPDACAYYLRAGGFSFYDWPDAGKNARRLVCSWCTKEEDVTAMIAAAREVQP